MGMRMHRLFLVLLVTQSCFLFGCGASILGGSVFGASVETNKTVAKPPSDVTVYVSVKDSAEPVGYLTADNFEIYENDVRLDQKEIGLRMLPRNSVASGHTVLLLDLSGPPEEKELKRISRGAAQFVEKVSTTQSVTVVAFDGTERAREVARFSRVETSAKRPLPELAAFLSKDASRDLHSALLAAIKGLTASLKAQAGGVHYGTVVALVRGPDLAGRKTENDVRSAISKSGYEFYSISPEDLKMNILSSIGKDERFTYETIDTLPMRFQDLGMRVRSAWQSHYLISYCSPARAGVRKLRVKVTYENESGSRRSASTKSEFDATGFQAGCTAKQTHAELAPAPPNEGESAVSENPGEGSGVNPARPSAPSGESDEKVVAPPPTGNYE